MSLHHFFILSTAAWALACSPAQEPCGGKVATALPIRAADESGQSISLLAGRGLGGMLFYNSTVSMDPSVPFEPEHVAARSVHYWFYKDPTASGSDQFRVMIFGKKFMISDASQKDYVIAIWVGDGYIRLPVKGLLTQQIQKFATDASLWTGADQVPLKRSLVSSLFGLQGSTSLQNGVADDQTSRQQWCFAASPQCLSPNDLGVIIASIDFSDLNRHHVKATPEGNATNADIESWFNLFVQHQNTLKGLVPSDTASDFTDLLILHKAIYENSTRAKLLNADLSSRDSKFAAYRDEKVPVMHDCELKTVAEFKSWATSQTGTATVEYCLPGAGANLSVQINMANANNPITFTEHERIALLQELLNRFYSLASKDPANWSVNFNRIGAVQDGNPINDKLVYESLSFSEFIQPTLAVTAIGFQNYADTEAGHFFINYKDKNTFPHTQYPDFNHDFQESSMITYKKIFPIQILPNRDSLGESGGASVNRLPVSKTNSRATGSSTAPETPEKEPEAGEISTKNCK